MPRESLTKHLIQIQDEVLLLGSMVEQAMRMAVDSLKRRDRSTAREIPKADQRINEKRFAIENAILILIATQQPMAHDLRFLTAMLEVSTELERMGDYAKGIAKVVIRLGDSVIPIPMRDIEKMTDLAISMLHRSLTAFIQEDAATASAIPMDDEQVDGLYNDVYRFIVQAMITDPSIIDHANLLLWVAHNLERMADRVTNICERTVFIATGELLEIDSTDDESVEE
jgi:phosphate transport system protein